MLSAKTVHLDLKMKLSDNGLVNSYEIQKDGEIVFQFNNPQVSMIFLLNRLFPVTRSTIWRYCKNASILGGMNIFEEKDEISINGAWTHLLRSSCSKMYEDAGAKHSLVQKKMRHGGKDVTDRYTKVDLNTLLDWEEEHLHTCLAQPVIEKPFVKPLLEVVN